MSLGLFAFVILGGVVADRFSQRRIIITVQGCTALVMAAVAALSLTGTIELWHVGVASFAMGAGSAFFYPAYSVRSATPIHANFRDTATVFVRRPPGFARLRQLS